MSFFIFILYIYAFVSDAMAESNTFQHSDSSVSVFVSAAVPTLYQHQCSFHTTPLSVLTLYLWQQFTNIYAHTWPKFVNTCANIWSILIQIFYHFCQHLITFCSTIPFANITANTLPFPLSVFLPTLYLFSANISANTTATCATYYQELASLTTTSQLGRRVAPTHVPERKTELYF